MNIKGSIARVTGANSGIGTAFVDELFDGRALRQGCQSTDARKTKVIGTSTAIDS